MRSAPGHCRAMAISRASTTSRLSIRSDIDHPPPLLCAGRGASTARSPQLLFTVELLSQSDHRRLAVPFSLGVFGKFVSHVPHEQFVE